VNGNLPAKAKIPETVVILCPRRTAMDDTPKARHRSTDSEKIDRIEQVSVLVSLGQAKCAILKSIIKKFGVSRKTAGRYHRAAQNLLTRWSNRDRKRHFIEATSFYWGVIRSPGTSWRDKIKARQCLDALFGLEAPKELDISGKHKGRIEITTLEVVRPVLAARTEVPSQGVNHDTDLFPNPTPATPAALELGAGGVTPDAGHPGASIEEGGGVGPLPVLTRTERMVQPPSRKC
jgi:hypothetical protein